MKYLDDKGLATLISKIKTNTIGGNDIAVMDDIHLAVIPSDYSINGTYETWYIVGFHKASTDSYVNKDLNSIIENVDSYPCIVNSIAFQHINTLFNNKSTTKSDYNANLYPNGSMIFTTDTSVTYSFIKNTGFGAILSLYINISNKELPLGIVLFKKDNKWIAIKNYWQ